MANNILGGTGVWATAGNWSQGTIPTATDGYITTLVNGTTPTGVTVVTALCQILSCSGYSGTVSIAASLSVYGNITLGTGMHFTGSGYLAIIGPLTSSIKSNGVLIPYFRFGGGGGALALTLNDDMNCTLFYDNAVAASTINGFNIYCASLTQTSGGYSILGTTNFIFNTPTTGTWTSGNASVLWNNITINCPGTLNIVGNVYWGGSSGNTLSYISGSTIVSGSTLNIGTGHLSTSGMSWNNVIISGSINIDQNLTCQNLTCAVNAGTINGSTIYINGSLSMSNTLGVCTTAFVMQGSGTWSGAGNFGNNLTFNTTGTCYVNGTVNRNGGTIKYIQGNIVTSGSTLTSTSSIHLDTSGMSWNNVTLGGTSMVYTFDSNMRCNTLTTNPAGTITLSASTVYCTNLSSSQVIGTTNIIIDGNQSGVTGLWNSLSTLYWQNNTTINTTGNLKIDNVYFGGTAGNAINYLSGNIIMTGTSTLYLNNNSTLNLNNQTVANVKIAVATSTIRLNSGLKISGLLNSLDSATHSTLSASTLTHLTLLQGASADLDKIDPINIDSSQGLTIYTNRGIITNSPNWKALAPYSPLKKISFF